MENGKSAGDMLRFIGFATVCVGLAWAVQVLGFGDAAGLGRFMWVMAAATVCGSGVGLVVASNALTEPEMAVTG